MIHAEPRLIEAACGGDATAVEELLAVCQPDLARFARRTCRTPEDAEDAVQIALWQLYRRIGALRTSAAFAAWLFKIVKRECYRLLRARDKFQEWDRSLDQVLRHDPIPVELRADLSAAIAALPPAYRTVLVLRDIDELTAPEVADQLRISIEAVKSRLHRARAMMREHLLTNGYLASEHAERRQ
jgi:RNA polymerase sigma factor (sigma-70 family)